MHVRIRYNESSVTCSSSFVLQVMSPMRKASAGVNPLNTFLQGMLNPAAPGRAELTLPRSHGSALDDGRSPVVLREGDRVIQCSNNYQIDVFNGDIGFVTQVKSATRELSVQYQGQRQPYLQTCYMLLCAAGRSVRQKTSRAGQA